MTEWIITSSVLIVIIAVLRFILRGKISLKLQYALWGLVLIRLLIPFSIFESSASVLNLMQEREETYIPPAVYEPDEPEDAISAVPDGDIFILDDNIEQIKPNTNITVDDNGFVTEPEIRVISAKDALIPIWIGGMVVLGAVFAVSNLRFGRKLKKTRQYVNDKKTWLPVYLTPTVKTPCLFGAVKPAIYVTEEVLLDEKTLCHVLEHETTHYRHGDHVWSVLRCLCLAVHWYNPLVWLAAFLSMRDSELACDEATIGRIGESERIEYGRTLINLTCEKPAVGILSAATTMTGSKSSIKERIMLIAKKPKMLWITAVLVAITALVAVGCTFTGPIYRNPKTADIEVTETFLNKIKPELSGLDGTIKMTVTAASPKEITTVIYNETSEEICYSTGYALHFEQDGKWYELSDIVETTDVIFFDVQTKFVSAESVSSWTNNVRESYGKLPDGKYIIIRTVSFGEMDISENEFYVIAAEFVLENGKLVYEAPSELKGEYIPVEDVYTNPLSSFLGIPERRYKITENTFAVYDSESGAEIESILVSEWKWEEFPYSEEIWNGLFTVGIDIPDISQYQSKYYQPLDSMRFIASLDGELWLVELSPIKPDSNILHVWSIYEIATVETAETEEFSEPEIIADHIAALNQFSLGTYGAEFEEDKYGTFLFSEYPENTGIVPDAVTFERVNYGSEEKPMFNGYYLDPFERTVQPVTNYSSKQELYDYIGKYLAKDLFEYDYYMDDFVELDGKLYSAVGNIGNIVITYRNCKIVSETENEMVVSADIYYEYSGQTDGTIKIKFEKQNGNWIITFFGNVSNYEENRAKEIYNSKIHSEYLKGINERIISYRDGTFEPMENHHPAYPTDFPSLANVGYVPEEAVALAWRNTVESGRTIHDGALDYIVVIDKTHAVILEPAEFRGDWGISYGFANTGYLNSEELGYTSVYEWIKATYTDYYSAVKMKNVLSAERGTPLTNDEVKRVSEAFEIFSLLANFLQYSFERPEEMNAAAILYYFPGGMLITDEAEFDDLKEIWASYGKTVPEGTTIDDYPVPLHKIPKSTVDEALEKYFGVSLEELRYSDLDSLAEGNIYYMEKYDCFYSTASDAHASRFLCISGEKFSDGTVILYGEEKSTLTLKKHPDGSYKIYSYYNNYH